MALVEAVVGELRQEIEDLVGLRPGQAALDGAVDEPGALGVHLLLNLLAHRPAQHVGFAQRIAGERLRDLHHLFLIDDDPEGLAQHRLDHRMDRVRLLVAELARAIGWDVGHRSGAVEGDQRDDVLETVGPHFDEGLAHARAFHLEHADRLAASEHREGLRVVERDRAEVDRDAAARDEVHRALQRRQRLEAEEVELDQSRRLDPLHVELGRRHRSLRVAIERHQFGQRPVADDDAGRMGRGVGIEPLEPLGDGEHRGHPLVGLGRLLEPRLVRDRLFQRDGMGRVLRHELGEPVDLAERHFEHAADVAQNASGEEGAEGDDLRDPIGAVALAHIGDHLVAPILAEVDVEVRHRHAFGIEKPLEQQAEPDRVEVGDGERPGDERARARSRGPARPESLAPSPIG